MNTNSFSPDFSSIKATLLKSEARLQEMMRAFAESVQEMMHPITEALEEFQSQFKEVTRPLCTIGKLGNAQFVCWSYMTRDFVDAIIATDNINKTLRELMVKDRYKTVDDTIHRCFSNSLIKPHHRLLEQSVAAFKSGRCDLAVIGLTSIIDGLLSDVSGNKTTNIATRAKTILAKIEQNEFVDSDEYAILALVLTFEKTMNIFSASSDFSKKEPKGLNRHWIMHGRSRRKKTKLDCVKLINLTYGILLIDEFGK